MLSFLCMLGFTLPQISLMSRSIMVQEIPDFINRFPQSESVIKTIRFQDEEARSFHYVVTGNPDGQLLVFIHGAPGDWQNFLPFLENPELQKRFKMIAVDRPGYGLSGSGSPELSLSKQAQYIITILSENQSSHQNPVIVGHSYGSPVAARILMDFPEVFEYGILISGPSIPDTQARWWNHLAHFPPIRWILPKDLFVASEEIYSLYRKELVEMESLWTTIETPISIIHGEEDTFVGLDHAKYTYKRVDQTIKELIFLKDIGHATHQDSIEIIIKEILKTNHLHDDMEILPALHDLHHNH